MKTRVVQLLIIISKYILRFIYSFLKLFPTNKNKVVFCSRQSSSLPLDFELIQDYLKKEHSEIKCVSICCRVTSGTKSYMLFLCAVLKSMYHLATAKVCVLDSYWPAVCMLKHKDDLKVIQIWHALGKLKKSGHASVGKKSGRKQEYAKLIHMHENYDYVIAGGEAWNPYYCESFNIDKSKILNYGLPRIDYLLDTEKKNKELFYEKYPELENKKVVLYVPTFRRNMKSKGNTIIDGLKDFDIAVIIKKHPGQKASRILDKTQIYYLDDWKTIDLLAVCDCVITDYSAIALEAAVLKKKIYFWAYDYESYIKNNGINLDLKKVAGGNFYSDVKILISDIMSDVYDKKSGDNYRKNYLLPDMGTSTKKITELIIKHLN